MYTTTFTAALFAALPAFASAGNAIVNNYCSEDVYVWSIDNTNYSPPMHTIAQGGQYSEPYRAPPTGGVSIKMATDPNLYKENAILAQFEYTLTDTLWYDISIINGNPFTAGGLNLIPSKSSCPAKYCAPGQIVCADAYNVPDDNQATAACSASSDTVFNLCPAQKGSSSPAPAPAPAPVHGESGPQAPAITHAPAAAPATTVAPNLEEVVITADGHPDWVWTTFFTKYVTVYERDAAPIAEPTAAPAAHEKVGDKKHKKHGHPHHGHHHGADEA